MQNAEKIIKRAMTALGIDSVPKFAKHLGVAPTTVYSWMERNSIKYNKLFSKCGSINLHWLLTGEGEMFFGSRGGQPQTISTLESASVILAEAARLISRELKPNEGGDGS